MLPPARTEDESRSRPASMRPADDDMHDGNERYRWGHAPDAKWHSAVCAWTRGRGTHRLFKLQAAVVVSLR